MEKVYFKPYVTSGDKERMEKDLIRLTESRLRKQTMDRWELCTDCPYPARGFVCWSENQECLLTRMMVLDGREDEVKQITRLNRINEAIDPFRIYDFRNGTYAFVLRLSKFPPSMRISCQNSFNSFAEMHSEPVKINERYTHGNPHEWRLVFDSAYREVPGFTLMECDVTRDGFNYYSTDLTLLEQLGASFFDTCHSRTEFRRQVWRALRKLPKYRTTEE